MTSVSIGFDFSVLKEIREDNVHDNGGAIDLVVRHPDSFLHLKCLSELVFLGISLYKDRDCIAIHGCNNRVKK